MTVVFDLDHTLLDAEKLKRAMAASLVSCGVSDVRFLETYEASSRVSDLICDYDPARHVAALADGLTCDHQEARRRIGAVVDRMSEFIMPGAVSVLQRLRASKAALVLFTHGNVAWQKRKVARSGLADRFDAMIFAPEEKTGYVEELRRLKPPLVVVNDHGGEIDGLRKELPDARFIAVRGPKPPPGDPDVPVCGDLEEVYKKIMELVR